VQGVAPPLTNASAWRMTMANRMLPSQEYLCQCLDYNPDTGGFVWKRRPLDHFVNEDYHRRWNKRFPGKEAGKVCNGYHMIGITKDRVEAHWRAHRIAWKIMTGLDPLDEIDHIDTNSRNNAWTNLRPATRFQNAKNVSSKPFNTSGFKGVGRHGSNFRFEITYDGNRLRIGGFKTPEEAYAAYCEAARKLHGEFFNPG
jgi:HNH endonuclease